MKKMSKNAVVTVEYIVGETAMRVLEEIGDDKYRFVCDAYIDDSDQLRPGLFKHLRQAIPARKGRVTDEVKAWPRLRKALQLAGVRSVNIPGGEYPLHYADEIAVPDYNMSGAHYFVIPRKEIGKYLDQLPLGEAGLARRQKMEQAELDRWLESRDPDYVADSIGHKFWLEYHSLSRVAGDHEFVKLTIVDDNGCQKSVVYPTYNTNLIWERCTNVPKIVCEAPETGVEFLSPEAAVLDPRNHHRIEKWYCEGWSCDVAYLQPKAEMADFVGDTQRWLRLFDGDDVISHKEIADAKRILLEVYNLTDELLSKKLVYSRETNEVKLV